MLFFTVSVFALPVVLVLSRRCWNLRSITAGAVTFALAAVVRSRGTGLVSNSYLATNGSYNGVALGEQTLWFTAFPWSLSDLPRALVAGILAAAALAAPGALRELDRMSTLYFLGVAASLLAPALLGEGLFDRYVLPLVVPMIVIVLAGTGSNFKATVAPTPLRRVLGAGCWTVGVLHGRLHHVPGPQRARLRRCTVARSPGHHPGWDVSNRHRCWARVARLPLKQSRARRRRGRDAWFWATSMFDSARSCYLVSASLRERGRTREHEHLPERILARNVHPVRIRDARLLRRPC